MIIPRVRRVSFFYPIPKQDRTGKKNIRNVQTVLFFKIYRL